MKRLILITLLFLYCETYSQEPIKSNFRNLGIEIGYKYKYSNNMNFGLSHRIISEDDFLTLPSWVNINVAYLTDFKNENHLMTGLQASLYLIELGIHASTKKDIEPTLGFNIGNRARLNFGYNISFVQKNNFTFGLYYAINCSSSEYVLLK